MQTRDLKRIQPNTQSDNRGRVRIPTPIWADILSQHQNRKVSICHLDPQLQSRIFRLKKL